MTWRDGCGTATLPAIAFVRLLFAPSCSPCDADAWGHRVYAWNTVEPRCPRSVLWCGT